MTKPTFKEIGSMLCAAGRIMARTGLMPGAILGCDRDMHSDDDMLDYMRDHGIRIDRALELLELSLTDIAELGP